MRQIPGTLIVDFYDDISDKKTITIRGRDFPIISQSKLKDYQNYQFIVGVGYPSVKRILVQKALAQGLRPAPTIISKHTYLGDAVIGSGGIIAAEHVPKALLCGLDAVAMDTPLMVALQAAFDGDCLDSESSNFSISSKVSEEWGVQRILNLTASWRDQLLEILGAMGMREVRRLRGEMGRAMFAKSLEREAFAGIEGYDG